MITILAVLLLSAPPASGADCSPSLSQPLTPVSEVVAAASSNGGTASFEGYRYAKNVLADVLGWLPAGTEAAELLRAAIPLDRYGDENEYLKRQELEEAAVFVKYEALDTLGCAAGNGSHRVERFKTLPSRDALLERMRAFDETQGCTGRTYASTDAASAAAFDAFTKEDENYGWQIESCDDEQDAARAATASLLALTTDPNTVSVVISQHDRAGEDDPVSCYYTELMILRRDGSLLQFDFDFGD